MARIWVFFVSCFILWSTISADEVESKADDMAKAIAQQNKKVEEESDAMEEAIDEKGKQVNTKEQEEKFEKASKQVDAVGNVAENKFEQKANLVDKLADDANNAIENQEKKVEALGNQADLAEDSASKMVDKIGKQVEKSTESRKPKTRMSISYTVQVPHEPHSEQMIQKASEYDKYIKSNEEAEKTYPWPRGHKHYGYAPDYHESPDDTESDMSLKPFEDNNADVEHDALTNEGYEETPARVRSNLKKMFYMPQPPVRPPHRRRLGKHRHHLKGYRPRLEKALLFRPTSKSSDLGLLVLPSGGPRQLSPDIKNQLEDDQLLRKAAKQAFNNDEDMDITEEMRKSDAEENMERQWMKINAIGSPELLLHWPRTSKNLGTIGKQQVSVVSPGEVDLLQTEYPEYPKAKTMGSDFPGIVRSKIRKKIRMSSKTKM